MAESIKVTIDKKTGRTTIEAQGFQGSSCLEATKALTAKLGPPTARQLKPEFHDAPCAERQRQYE